MVNVWLGQLAIVSKDAPTYLTILPVEHHSDGQWYALDAVELDCLMYLSAFWRAPQTRSIDAFDPSYSFAHQALNIAWWMRSSLSDVSAAFS